MPPSGIGFFLTAPAQQSSGYTTSELRDKTIESLCKKKLEHWLARGDSDETMFREIHPRSSDTGGPDR